MGDSSRQHITKYIFFLLIVGISWFGNRVVGDLIVSEVYIDGTDEWIEITNNGETPFEGSFTLSGAKSSLLNYTAVVLAPGASFLLGDQCSMLLAPALCIRDQGLSLTDTKELKLTLTQQSIDGIHTENIFLFPLDLVVSVNDKKTSLSCTYPMCTEFSPTPFFQSNNVIEGIIANPGLVFQDNETPQNTGEHIPLKLPYFLFTNSGELLTITGEIYNNSCEQSCFLILTGATTTIVPIQTLSGQIWSTQITLTSSGQSEEIVIWSLSSASGILLSGHYTMLYSTPVSGDTTTSTNILTGDQTGDNETDNNTAVPTDNTNISGQQDNLETQPPLPQINFSEIHATHDTLPEYIELTVHTPSSGLLSIQGAGNGQGTKTILLHTSTPQRVIITSQTITGIEHQYVLPSLSLTDAGEELTLLRQSGQQIDKAVYMDAKKGFSQYFSSFSGLDKNFTRFGPPTPSISEELYSILFPQISGATFPQCEVIFQHTSPLYAHHKINLQASLNNKPLTNTSLTHTCIWSVSGTLFTGCNPSFISVSQAGVYPLSLHIYTDTTKTALCSTTTSLNLPELPQTTSCRAEYYSGLYNNRKEKYGILSSAIRSYGFRVSGSGTNITLTSPQQQKETKQITGVLITGRVIIMQLLPNPQGDDVGTEWIEIQSTTGEIISGTLILSNGNSSRSFPPQNIPPGKIYGFTGSWGLLNSSACITLAGSGIIYDTYCYTTPKEGIIPPRRNTENQVLALSPKTTLSFVGDQVCAKQQGQIVVCKELTITKAELKDLKKASKKSTSLEKKLATALKRRDKHKKLSTQFTTYKKQQSKITSQLKQQYKRATSTLYTLKHHLQSHRILTYQDPYILSLYKLYTLLEQPHNTTQSHYGKQILSQDISQIQDISLGNTVYDEEYIPDLITYLLPIIQSYTHKATPLDQIQPP